MKFFEKTRVQLYFHGGKLLKDRKTDQRRWRLNLVVTLEPHDVLSCEQFLLSAYQTIDAGENRIEEMKLSAEIPAHTLSFFGLADHSAPIIALGRCDLTELKLTRSEDLIELWFKAEHECTDALHRFVKDYSFQRFWAEFTPAQMSLTEVRTAPEAPAPIVQTPKGRIN